jgi:hypothetical protein
MSRWDSETHRLWEPARIVPSREAVYCEKLGDEAYERHMRGEPPLDTGSWRTNKVISQYVRHREAEVKKKEWETSPLRSNVLYVGMML